MKLTKTLFLVPVLTLAACGSSGKSDKDTITQIIKDGDSNPASLCDNLDDALLKQLGGADGCKKAAAAEAKDTATVNSVTVDGDTATADVTDKDGPNQKITLKKVDGTWKVSSTPGG